MKKVMVFGTFDGLHEGHKNLFKQSRKFGDYLIAVVARNKTVKEIKGRKPKRDEEERLTDVMKCELVDESMLGLEDDKFKIIKEARPDVICLGYDQTNFVDELKKEIKKMDCNIIIHRLHPFKPEIYKSSKLNKDWIDKNKPKNKK